jgi:antitoxin component YwqK of YwqJK toxin-antitoxin module
MILLFDCSLLIAQTNDTINQIKDGSRHGYWIINGDLAKDKNYVPVSKVEEGMFNMGRRDGVWTKYYPEGTIKSKINYVNGKSQGAFTTYYKNGKIEENGNWESKVYRGNFIRYYENGKVAQKKAFNKKGKTEGKVVYYYPNGQQELVFETINGMGKGNATRFWPNGDVKEKLTFNEKGESKSSGTIKRKNTPVKNARLIMEKKQAVIAEGKLNIGPLPSVKGKLLKDGYHKTYNENKDILMDGEFNNGKLWTGKHYIYDDNGLIERIDVYKNGNFEGNGVI